MEGARLEQETIKTRLELQNKKALHVDLHVGLTRDFVK